MSTLAHSHMDILFPEKAQTHTRCFSYALHAYECLSHTLSSCHAWDYARRLSARRPHSISLALATRSHLVTIERLPVDGSLRRPDILPVLLRHLFCRVLRRRCIQERACNRARRHAHSCATCSQRREAARSRQPRAGLVVCELLMRRQ
eukprot:6175498-Pleurochrysis_carterae.AAC.1